MTELTPPDGNIQKPTAPANNVPTVVLPEHIKIELQKHAEQFITTISTLPVKSPAFNAYIERIDQIGSNLNNPQTFNKTLNNPQTTLTVQENITNLNNVVKELNPTTALKTTNMFGLKTRDPYGKMFTKYAEAETQIRNAIKGLYISQDLLVMENAHLVEEAQHLLEQLQKLEEYNILVEALQTETTKIIKQYGEHSPLAVELTFALNHKKQDMLVRTTVLTQAYLALNLIRENNIQLQRNISTAKTTTVVALQTAQTVATALGVQADIIDTLNNVVNDTGVSVNQTNMKTLQDTRTMLTKHYNTLEQKTHTNNLNPTTVDERNQIETIKNKMDNIQQLLNEMETHLKDKKTLKTELLNTLNENKP